MIKMIKRFKVSGYGATVSVEKNFSYHADAIDFYEEIAESGEYSSGCFLMNDTGEVLAHFEFEEADGYTKITRWVKNK